MPDPVDSAPASRKAPLLLPPAMGAALALGAAWGMSALPIDDAYILARYAANLASGMGFAFNPGETSFGSTSFLFPIILSIIIKITGSSYIVPALTIGVASFIALILLVEWWTLEETSSVAIAAFAGALVAVSPMGYMNAASGMESMTYALALVGALAFYRKFGLKRPAPLGMLAALTFLMRPEGLYLVIVVPGLEIVSALMRKRKPNFAALALFVIGFALPALPYLAFVKMHTGGFMPTTYAGKIVSTDPAMHRSLLLDLVMGANHIYKGAWRTAAPFGIVAPMLWTAALTLLTAQVAGFIKAHRAALPDKAPAIINATLIAALGVAFFASREPKLLAVSLAALFAITVASLIKHLKSDGGSPEDAPWNIALILVLTFPFAYGSLFRAGPIFGGYYNRYILPTLPAFAILASCGLAFVAKIAAPSRKRTAEIGFAALFVYTILFGISRFGEHRGVYAAEARFNGGIRTQSAKWIAANTPPEAKVLVGYTGLGVVGGLCERRVSDLGALINPDIFPYFAGTPSIGPRRWMGTLRYIADTGIDYYVTVPGIDDPSSDPTAEPGFSEVAKFVDPAIQGRFSTITIWKIDRDAVKKKIAESGAIK